MPRRVAAPPGGGSATVPGGPKRTRAVVSGSRAGWPCSLPPDGTRQHSDRTETHGNRRFSLHKPGGSRRQKHTESATTGRVACSLPPDGTKTAQRPHGNTRKFAASPSINRGKQKTKTHRSGNSGPGGLALSADAQRRTETHGIPASQLRNPGGSGRQKHTEAATSGRVALLSPAGGTKTAQRPHGNTRKLAASPLHKPREKAEDKTDSSLMTKEVR
jgi:hypothetical protein